MSVSVHAQMAISFEHGVSDHSTFSTVMDHNFLTCSSISKFDRDGTMTGLWHFEGRGTGFAGARCYMYIYILEKEETPAVCK